MISQTARGAFQSASRRLPPITGRPVSASPGLLANLSRWYRWGWLPLIAGCAGIAGGVFLVWRVLFASVKLWTLRGEMWLDIARDATTTVLLAAWAGYFVLRSRARIEGAQAELRTREAQLIERSMRTEELAGLGALSRIVAHEIRGPLNALLLHCRLLERTQGLEEVDCDEQARIVEKIAREAKRIDRTVSEYLDYSRQSERIVPTDRVSVDAIVADVVELHREAFPEQNVALSVWKAPHDSVVRGDAVAIRQIVESLLRYVASAAPPGARVGVSTQRDGASATLELVVEGAPFHQPERMFRPFYRPPGATSGLSLAIARDTVRAHGGEIVASNLQDPSAARIAVRLPLAEVRT